MQNYAAQIQGKVQDIQIISGVLGDLNRQYNEALIGPQQVGAGQQEEAPRRRGRR